MPVWRITRNLSSMGIIWNTGLIPEHTRGFQPTLDLICQYQPSAHPLTEVRKAWGQATKAVPQRCTCFKLTDSPVPSAQETS